MGHKTRRMAFCQVKLPPHKGPGLVLTEGVKTFQMEVGGGNPQPFFIYSPQIRNTCSKLIFPVFPDEEVCVLVQRPPSGSNNLTCSMCFFFSFSFSLASTSSQWTQLTWRMDEGRFRTTPTSHLLAPLAVRPLANLSVTCPVEIVQQVEPPRRAN